MRSVRYATGLYATGAVVRLHSRIINRLSRPFSKKKRFRTTSHLPKPEAETRSSGEDGTTPYSFFASGTLSRPSPVNHSGALSNPSSMAVSAAAEDSTNMIRI
ncbi:hypothetical protein HMPREF1207_03448 [Paenibacillus sp. HGH0039]|nr:hypothetical protein HMPREF1207_03448 [Paenibacillus sp. HGH0039]